MGTLEDTIKLLKSPKLNWIKHRHRDIWTVPKFPFFSLIVVKSYSCEDRFQHEGIYETFATLKEAKIACEKHILECIIKWQRDNTKIFDYKVWCNNTACGKYLIKENNYEKYHWLCLRYNAMIQIYRQKSIRFDINIPYEKVVEQGIKIQKRHFTRYINLMNS